MLAQALSRFSMPWLSCIGLMIFVIVFVGVMAWVHRSGSDSIYQRAAALPLDDCGNGVEQV